MARKDSTATAPQAGTRKCAPSKLGTCAHKGPGVRKQTSRDAILGDGVIMLLTAAGKNSTDAPTMPHAAAGVLSSTDVPVLLRSHTSISILSTDKPC